MTREVTQEQLTAWLDLHPMQLTRIAVPDHVPPLVTWQHERGGVVALTQTDNSTSPPTVKYFICAY